MKVRNVEGHFENPPQGSWIAYWEEKAEKKAAECNDVTCHETNDLVGGHVLKVPFDGAVYLTPLTAKDQLVNLVAHKWQPQMAPAIY